MHCIFKSACHVNMFMQAVTFTPGRGSTVTYMSINVRKHSPHKWARTQRS